eukprot:15358828-Ditylum_brightwellii.AAC.1
MRKASWDCSSWQSISIKCQGNLFHVTLLLGYQLKVLVDCPEYLVGSLGLLSANKSTRSSAPTSSSSVSAVMGFTDAMPHA